MERRLSQVMRGRGPASRSGFRKPFQKHMAGLLGEGKASSAGTQPRSSPGAALRQALTCSSSPAAAHLQERLTFPGLHPIRKGAWEMGKEGRRKSIKRVMKRTSWPRGHVPSVEKGRKQEGRLWREDEAEKGGRRSRGSWQ